MVISILIFTFYIINQIHVSIIIKHLTGLIFVPKTGVVQQPEGGTPVLNVMAIRDQRHASVSKRRTLLADVDVTMSKGVD